MHALPLHTRTDKHTRICVHTRTQMVTTYTHATQTTRTAFAQLEKGSLDGAMKTLVALNGVGPGLTGKGDGIDVAINVKVEVIEVSNQPTT